MVGEAHNIQALRITIASACVMKQGRGAIAKPHIGWLTAKERFLDTSIDHLHDGLHGC
jgi:hypothetical protein